MSSDETEQEQGKLPGQTDEVVWFEKEQAPAETIKMPSPEQECKEIPAQLASQPAQMFIPKAAVSEEQKQNIWQKFKAFVSECRRVVRVTRKPDKQEFTTIVKISGIGILIIGLIGFIVHMLRQLVEFLF